MKKSILIGIGILTMAIGGIFFGTKVVKAENPYAPILVIGMETNHNTIYKDTIFKISLDIDAGTIKSKEAATNADDSDRSNNIKIKMKEGSFEIHDVKVGVKNKDMLEYTDKEVKYDKLEVEINELQYIYDEHEQINGSTAYKFKGPNLTVDLYIKVLNVVEIELGEILSFEYGDGAGGIISISVENETNITSEVIQYRASEIEGVNIEGVKLEDTETIGVGEVPVNKEFSMNYTLAAGQLGDGNPIPVDIKERDLIYLIDSSVIDKRGGNDETARISIKKALEDIKQNKPDTKGSIVVYGENAKIIEVDDKTSLSIDQMIAEIDKIEATDESGNLGDGIRKAKYLANENKGALSSIVIVSNGNPNYYTQVSEGNTSLLETRVNKDGVAKFDREKAEEYTNNIVNDIAINEEDDTRWYGINYAIEDQELLLNDSIEKLDGSIETIKNPYYDDFKTINNMALVQIQIVAEITATVSDEYKDIIEINVNDKEQEKVIGFDIDGSNRIVSASTYDENFKVRAKFNSMLGTPDYINVADPEHIIISTVIKVNGTHAKAFNGGGHKWNVKPVVDTLVYKGLYNGRTDLTFMPAEGQNMVEIMEGLATYALDVGEQFELAEENHYSAGVFITTLVDKPIRIIKDRDAKAEIYEVTESGLQLIDGLIETLKANKVYFIKIDDYIEPGKIDVNGNGKSFRTGLSIIRGNEHDDEWTTINIVPVPKPDHF